MKKILIFVLAMCLLFSLTACEISENEPKPTAEPLEKTVSPATEPPAEKPAEIPAAEQKTDTAEKVFTNEYGTSTTKCAHAGCTRPIASSGDTNCCTVHSGTCAKCGRYIDEDATWCMKCLTSAASGAKSSSESSSSSSSSSSGTESYYCMGETQHLSQQNIQPVGFLLFFLRS